MRPGEIAVGPSNTTSTALETSHVIKAAAGRLYGFSGYNNKSAAQYIQVFDATAVPADTAVPVIVVRAEANSNFSYDSGGVGRVFTTGICVSNSSTVATKTIGSADCWFDFQYT